jgi:hypothetical protein
MKTYNKNNECEGKPWDLQLYNSCADYVVNAGLVEAGVGMMNPDWLWADDVDGNALREEVYARKWQQKPPGQGGGSGAGGANTYRDSGKAPKGAKGDPTAAQHGQDQVLEPETDPVTGREDLPSDMEFKEAVARAAAAAKAMGNMPESLMRRVEEILQPQVDWREHLRMLVTGRVGARSETWNTPNRRYAVLSFDNGQGGRSGLYLPGRRGHGCDTVVVACDTSGSITPKELDAYMAEVGGVLQDVRPKRVVLMSCDARVHQVEEASTLDELQVIHGAGLKGGGGTSFIPVFDKIDELGLRPDALIYCTDMYGSFPDNAPAYPTIWAKTSDVPAPFGDEVRIVV